MKANDRETSEHRSDEVPADGTAGALTAQARAVGTPSLAVSALRFAA